MTPLTVQDPLKSGFHMALLMEGHAGRLEGGEWKKLNAFPTLLAPVSLPGRACLLCASVPTRRLAPSAVLPPDWQHHLLPFRHCSSGLIQLPLL